jgi:hypothetical protein
MKNILLPVIACCSVLLPFTKSEAKTYGGFTPGQTFTFTVKEKTCTKQVDFTPAVNVPVPAGIVNLGLGKKVTFTIGKTGQLKFKNTSLPFLVGKKKYNDYLLDASGGLSPSGKVTKNAKGKPIGVSLNFLKFETDGVSRTVTTVDYKLN